MSLEPGSGAPQPPPPPSIAGAAEPPPPATAVPAAQPPARRSRISLLVGLLLGVLLLAAVVALVLTLLQLAQANALIEQQREQLDTKETFGAAMGELMAEVAEFDGVLMATLVPFHRYERLAAQAWEDRRSPSAMAVHITGAQRAAAELRELREAAAAESAKNASRTAYEATTDRLGKGYVSSVLGNAKKVCGKQALGCVSGADPFTVTYDAKSAKAPYMTKFMQTGIAYHEFAHVLQFTNPEPTEVALKAFKGNYETMADCFALTKLKGWKLNHRVWVSGYQYWDVSLGYGKTCSGTQKQAIRDWYDQLGFRARPIAQ